MTLAGDPVVTTLGDGVEVDVRLITGEPADPAPLLDVGGDLIEGVPPACGPEFESWLLVRGMAASDRGDYPAALEYLGESVERARRCGDHRQHAWSL